MQLHKIPYQDTGYFSGLIADYLDRKDSLNPFYNRFPELAAFKAQCQEKLDTYPKEHRQVLYRALQEQYKKVNCSEATAANLEALSDSRTFTVVTGHQLNLFTGPLYFHYKIATAIVLCRRLKEEFPGYNFVPVYWMATEDHDFEEINHFNFRGEGIPLESRIWRSCWPNGYGRAGSGTRGIFRGVGTGQSGRQASGVICSGLFEEQGSRRGYPIPG